MSESEDFLYELDRDYNQLKISALKRAVEISPYVHEVTIGPHAIHSSKPVPENNVTASVEKNNKNEIVTNGDSLMYNKQSLSPKIMHQNNLIDRCIHECELQEKQTLDIMVKSMLNKMVTKHSEMMTRFWHQQELEYERKTQERRNREREIVQQLMLDDKMAQLEQEKLLAENRAHSERMVKLLEKQLESTRMFEQLDRNHSEIYSIYQDITNINDLENKDIYVNILQKYHQLLTNSLTRINTLAENCKSGNINKDDVTQSDNLKNQLIEIKENINIEYHLTLKELDEIANSEHLKTQTQHVENDNNNEIKRNEEIITNENNIKQNDNENEVYSYCSKKSLEYYLELKEFLECYENSYRDLLNDNSLKKFRFDCQKAVNIPVNSISSVSGSHLRDKFSKLEKLLNGDKVQVGDVYVTCSLHPQGKAYCMDLLAKKIVRQGEQTVSSNPDAAFPLASIVVALWAKFPDLGKLICAHFHKECPYLIPLFLPQSKELSDEDYYKAKGYKYDENGAVEKQDKFLKRMSGIFKLNAAIWIAKMPNSIKLPHPQGLAHAWRWMAAFVNLDPEVDITATLLFDFLTLCGAEFYKYYKDQFVKVLQYLINDYRKRIDKIDEGGPKVRLEVFLQNVIKDGKIPPPEGVLSDRVW